MCIFLSFSDFWEYQVAGAAAQFVLWFYAFFPFRPLRIVATISLGLGVLSSSMLLLICFVRSWRYFFFPVKEQLTFALVCLASIPILTAQLAFMFIQSKSLLEKKTAVYVKSLYKTTVYIMFFHDFVYAWALAPFGGIYILFAFTHFIVHTLMIALNSERDALPLQLWGFRLLWVALLVQHGYTLYMLFEYTIVRGLTFVYIVTALMYLVNSYLQSQRQTDSKSTVE